MAANLIALAKLLHSERCIADPHSNPVCLGYINGRDRQTAERVLAALDGAGT